MITKPIIERDANGYEHVVSQWYKKTFRKIDALAKKNNPAYYLLDEGQGYMTLAFLAPLQRDVSSGAIVAPVDCEFLSQDEMKKVDELYKRRNSWREYYEKDVE